MDSILKWISGSGMIVVCSHASLANSTHTPG